MIQPAPTNCRVAHVGLDESAIGGPSPTRRRICSASKAPSCSSPPARSPSLRPAVMGIAERTRIHRQLEVLALITARLIHRSPWPPFRTDLSGIRVCPPGWRWTTGAARLTSDNPLPPNIRLITFGGLPINGHCSAAASSRCSWRPTTATRGKALQFCENAIRITNPQRLPDHYIAPLRTLRSEDLDAYERGLANMGGRGEQAARRQVMPHE
jgi:hypothetical protein